MTTEPTPTEKWASMTRPLLYVRVRFFRGGQAEYIRDLLRDEQETLMDDLGKLRADGKPEDNDEIVEIRQNLVWLIDALRDLDSSLIELAGPDRDPR